MYREAKHKKILHASMMMKPNQPFWQRQLSIRQKLSMPNSMPWCIKDWYMGSNKFFCSFLEKLKIWMFKIINFFIFSATLSLNRHSVLQEVLTILISVSAKYVQSRTEVKPQISEQFSERAKTVNQYVGTVNLSYGNTGPDNSSTSRTGTIYAANKCNRTISRLKFANICC